MKVCEVDKTIKAVLAEDEMRLSHTNIVKNHSDSSKEEIKSIQTKINKTAVNDCDKRMKIKMKKAKIIHFTKIVTVMIH